MSRLRVKRLEYRINDWEYPGSRPVSGHAMDLRGPLTGLRFCVRDIADGDWKIDHYDSGYSAGVLSDCYSPEDAAKRAQSSLLFRLGSGELQDRLAAIGYGWCMEGIGE